MEPLLLRYKSVNVVSEGIGCLVLGIPYNVHTIEEETMSQWNTPLTHLVTWVEAKVILWLADLLYFKVFGPSNVSLLFDGQLEIW